MKHGRLSRFSTHGNLFSRPLRKEGCMKVRALKEGFFNNHRIKAGTIFDLPENMKMGAWMVEHSENEPVVVKAEEPRKPIAISQVSKKNKGKQIAYDSIEDLDVI